MVKIVIENLDRKELDIIDVSKTILRHLQDHFIDWMHACGGKGRCTTCKMIVVEGQENLSAPTEAELRYRDKGELGMNERLACQTRTISTTVIRVPEQGKMPHMTYSE